MMVNGPAPLLELSVRLTSSQQALLDEWIDRQSPPHPDRSQAICMLLDEAFERCTTTIAEHPHTRVPGIVSHEDEI
jgi:hypothetical protein